MVLAILTAVAWTALVVAAFGILSLVLDLEVIPQSDAGPLVGPGMVGVAGILLAVVLLRMLRTRSSPVLSFVAAAAGTYLAMLVTGGILYTFVRAEPVWLLVFPLTEAISPFVLAAAVLAGLSALGARAIGAAEQAGRERPRWPWERDDEP